MAILDKTRIKQRALTRTRKARNTAYSRIDAAIAAGAEFY
jgi:hypothetical protein